MKLKNLSLLLSAIALLAGAASASAQLLTAGDLIVSTYGSLTGTNVNVDGATPITLLEYSLPTATSASLVLTDQLPTTGVGANVGIQGEDGSSSEGTIQLSGNGEYLTIGGYDGNEANMGIGAATNTAKGTSFTVGTTYSGTSVALAQSSDSDVARVVATIDSAGDVNTSTAYGDNTYNTNNPRGVYSQDGVNFYLSGQGSGAKVGGVYTDQGGIYTTTFGNNTTAGGAAPTAILTVASTRDVLEYNNNLYYSADQNSSNKGNLTGIFEYSGTPTTSQGSNTGTRVTGSSGAIYAGGGFTGTGTKTTVAFSPEGFAFANPDTLYVADTGDPKAGGTGDGGIQKWTLTESGTWTLDYTLTSSNFLAANVATQTGETGETGFEALTLQVVGSNVDIYGVSYTVGPDGQGNGLYGVVDSLSNLDPTVAEGETVTELEISPGIDGSTANYNFKGVAFAPTVAVPEPGSYGMALCGFGMLLAFTRARRRRA